ncbi:MAG: prephenate dehydrogenase [Phycisphaeraceae bacterium]
MSLDSVLQDVRQITIVGTGLIGASAGLALKSAGFVGRIVGVGRRRQTVDRARERGCVDEASTDLAAAARDSQLLILAVPLGRFETVFQQLADCDHDGLILTDVGSTKQDVCALAHKHLPDPRRFIGSHPMAGSEHRGPDAARADLFNGKPCIITPDDRTDPAALRGVESLWTMLGMSLIRMSAQEHDRQTAVVSHLPHAVAVLLVQVTAELGGFDLASTGFRDTTRLASSNPPMRADILMANRTQIRQALRALHKQADSLDQLLQHADYDTLLKWLTDAKKARDDWLENRD